MPQWKNWKAWNVHAVSEEHPSIGHEFVMNAHGGAVALSALQSGLQHNCQGCGKPLLYQKPPEIRVSFPDRVSALTSNSRLLAELRVRPFSW